MASFAIAVLLGLAPSSQIAAQPRNGSANALKQLRDVEQISFQFVSEHSLRNARNSQLNR